MPTCSQTWPIGGGNELERRADPPLFVLGPLGFWFFFPFALLVIPVEVKTIAAAVLAMTRDEVVDERVDVRQFDALADFKTRDGDVADSFAIDLNRSIRSATTDGELLVLQRPPLRFR